MIAVHTCTRQPIFFAQVTQPHTHHIISPTTSPAARGIQWRACTAHNTMQVQCIVKLGLYASSSLTPTRCHTSPLCHRHYQCPGDVFVLTTYFTFLCYKAALWITHAFVVLAHMRQHVVHVRGRQIINLDADNSRLRTDLVGKHISSADNIWSAEIVGGQISSASNSSADSADTMLSANNPRQAEMSNH